MPYSLHLEGMPSHISADTAVEAVRKAKALVALGRKVAVHGPEGEPVELQMLELAVRGNRFPEEA
jgi:hypothetical protein